MKTVNRFKSADAMGIFAVKGDTISLDVHMWLELQPGIRSEMTPPNLSHQPHLSLLVRKAGRAYYQCRLGAGRNDRKIVSIRF